MMAWTLSGAQKWGLWACWQIAAIFRMKISGILTTSMNGCTQFRGGGGDNYSVPTNKVYINIPLVLACFKMTMDPANIMTFWHNMLHDITG